MDNANSAIAETQDEFPDTPEGWQKRWQMEMDAARSEVAKWHEQGDKVVKRFRDERTSKQYGTTRVNLFTSNVQTLRALLYGKVPTVSVERRFDDSKDDTARCAGELLQRLLNTDIERDVDTYKDSLQHALDDRLLVGIGTIKWRYSCQWQTVSKPPILSAPHPETGEQVEVAPGYEKRVKVPGSEDVCADYVYWQDQCWSPARTFGDVRFWAFKEPLSREQLIKRFGDVGKTVPLNAARGGRKGSSDSQHKDPWARADVWEIWDKEHRKVFWWVEGMSACLDIQDDTYGLEGFWPFPKPMFANLTTSSLVPRPDFVLAQDLYDEIDEVSTRITLLERCIRVVGTYDANVPELKRLLAETFQNELVPATNWLAFMERGGLKGSVDWLPIDMFVAALDKLREYRTELMNLLFQVTGMSDIMRGQSQPNATATEQALKAKFSSTRVQHFQDEFARFASDAQRIKAEIISKHFEPQTILERSNAQFMFDADIAAQAVDLLKSKFWLYRVEVKPEAVALTDFAALKAERGEFITSLATFLQAAMPAVQAMPGAMPMLLQMLQWSMAGFRGASTIEGVLDQAIAAAEQAQQSGQAQKPDPKAQELQMKSQMDSKHTGEELQADLVRTKAESQAEIQKQLLQHKINQDDNAAQIRSKVLRDIASPPAAGA